MAIQAQFPSCGSQQDWMENGCGGLNQLYGNVLQQKQQQQQLQQCNLDQLQNLLQRNKNLCFDNNVLASSTFKSNNNTNIAYSQSMAFYDEKQRQEIDHLIRLQNERLRLLLQEERKQQIGLLLKTLESKAMPFLRQKDEELAQATKRTMELEEFLKRLEMENQAWQRVAQEKEAIIVSLNSTIEQLKDKASCCFDNNGAEDAESCCDRQEKETEEANRGFDYDDDVDLDVKEVTRKKMMMTMMVCKGCNSRNSCMLFLPCRHLCSCKACEAFLDSCPVCQTAKKASIEALMV